MLEARDDGAAAPAARYSIVAAAVAETGSRSIIVVGGRESELAQRADALGVAHFLARAATLETAIALALRRLQELAELKRVLDRTAVVERAKGVLMERHRLTEREANALLRRHARNRNLKLQQVAAAVVGSHLLLPPSEPPDGR